MTAGPGPRVVLTGLPAFLADSVGPRLDSALAALELGSRLARVELCADDLPGEDCAWFRISPAGPGRRPGLTLYCPGEVFLRPRPATATLFPHREIWEQRPAPPQEDPVDPQEFSLRRCDTFLHHHLATVRDLLDGTLEPERLPAAWTQAFGAAWAVAVDGRLERAGLPGYPLTERRAAFSRLFSAAGVLMPDHWQVFQSLWEGRLATQAAVLEAAKSLPRL